MAEAKKAVPEKTTKPNQPESLPQPEYETEEERRARITRELDEDDKVREYMRRQQIEALKYFVIKPWASRSKASTGHVQPWINPTIHEHEYEQHLNDIINKTDEWLRLFKRPDNR